MQQLWGKGQREEAGPGAGRGQGWVFLHQKKQLQAEPKCSEVLAACQRRRKSAEVKIMLICTHTGGSGALEAGQAEREARGKEEEEGEDLHMKMLGLCVWGGSISKARIQMIPTKPKLS